MKGFICGPVGILIAICILWAPPAGADPPEDELPTTTRYPHSFAGGAIAIGFLGLAAWHLGERSDAASARDKAEDAGADSNIIDELDNDISGHTVAAGACILGVVGGVVLASHKEVVSVSPEGVRVGCVALDPMRKRVMVISAF